MKRIYISSKLLALICVFALSSCTSSLPNMVVKTSANSQANAQLQAEEQALEAAVNSNLRIDAARDVFRHPKETLLFFGVKPSDKVIEIYPAAGWYTTIIAQYLRTGNGEYIAAVPHVENPPERFLASINNYKIKFAENPQLYGKVSITYFGEKSGPLGAPASVDKVLVFRDVHNWVNGGFEKKAFADIFKVLKPGGVMGIEAHRGSNDKPQDIKAADGYLREDFMIELARSAGFEFVGKSEINANAKDTKDHPFGVWTLPPVLRTAPQGQPANPAFDNAKYREIGESDRMTILFRRPN